MVKKKPYKIKFKVNKNKFTKKDLQIRKAMADMYASSPYLTKKKKDKHIKDLYK